MFFIAILQINKSNITLKLRQKLSLYTQKTFQLLKYKVNNHF